MNAESSTRPPILSRPYSDRQMIVVVEDTVADMMQEMKLKEDTQKENDHSTFETVLETALLVTFPTPTILVKTARQLVRSWQRARDQGIPVLQIGKSEACQLDFPLGHPREGIVYVGHPAIPPVYNTIADFHRVTFEHKFREAISLLMNLGAIHMRVEHVSGWSKEFSSRLSVPLNEPDMGLSATGSSARSSQNELLFEANLIGTSEPRIPEGLVWYPREETWQAIAEARMEFGLKQFSMNVAYVDDFGINAKLKATIADSGFDLGGNFEDHRQTWWRIAGKFFTEE